MTAPVRTITGERTEVREPKFKLVMFDALRLSSTASYLVKGLIPRVGLVVVWGPPKCGKSFWIFDLMMHVALGWDYRGRKVRGGLVVYCALEGAEGFKGRAEAWRQRHLAEQAEPVPFLLMSTPLNLVADGGALIASIRTQVGETRPVAVVIDTLNRSLAGSESKDEDMAAYVRAADAIRDAFGCVVPIVHHSGIDATRPRGHTSLTGAADAQIAVRRDPAGYIAATLEWMKDGPEGAILTSRLEGVELGLDDDGDPITSCVIVPAESVETSEKAKVTGATKVALDLLWRAITDAGAPAQASNHIPSGSRTISLSLWRRYCDEGTVATSDKPDARRKAFVRATEKLQTLGLIGIWDEKVWLTKATGQAGHAPDKDRMSGDS